MATSSARPDALAHFANQLTTAADAVRPALGQLRDALARVEATCLDHRPELPPVVEMTAGLIGRDHELAAFARQVSVAFAATDAGSGVHRAFDSGGDAAGDTGEGPIANSEHGSVPGLPAISVLLSLPDVDRILRDGNPVDAWHDKGVAYLVDWAAIAADSATFACQAVHHPYVCIGGPALRGATNLLRWWASDTRLAGTDVRPHDIEARVASAVHDGVDGITDIVDDSKDVLETTLSAGERAAARATHAPENAVHHVQKAVAHVADEGSKLAHEGLHAAQRLARGLVPDLGSGFG